MKTKLLKKVRKRYEIIYYPKGMWIRDIFFEGPLVCLWDKDHSLFNYDVKRIRFDYPKQQAINDLKDIIIRKLINEGYGKAKRSYGKAKRNRANCNGVKVWP
jgi:hypothetical protein